MDTPPGDLPFGGDKKRNNGLNYETVAWSKGNT